MDLYVNWTVVEINKFGNDGVKTGTMQSMHTKLRIVGLQCNVVNITMV